MYKMSMWFFQSTLSSTPDEPLYVVEVLLYCAKTPKKLAGGEVPVPCKEDGKGEMQVNWCISYRVIMHLISYVGAEMTVDTAIQIAGNT